MPCFSRKFRIVCTVFNSTTTCAGTHLLILLVQFWHTDSKIQSFSICSWRGRTVCRRRRAVCRRRWAVCRRRRTVCRRCRTVCRRGRTICRRCRTVCWRRRTVCRRCWTVCRRCWTVCRRRRTVCRRCWTVSRRGRCIVVGCVVIHWPVAARDRRVVCGGRKSQASMQGSEGIRGGVPENGRIQCAH